MKAIDWRRLRERFVLHLDGWLLQGLLVLAVLGGIALYSASNRDIGRLESQLINMAVACVLMWIVAQVPAATMARLAPPLYVIGFVLLLGVFFAGESSHGAKRWLHLGVTRIQPSELMKLAVPMMLAWYFDRFGEQHRAWAHVVGAILIALPVALILKQPDLGTAMLIAISGFYVLFLSGLSWRLIACGVLLSLPMLYVVTHQSLCEEIFHKYQCTRVSVLLDPSQDPLGAGYHTLQGTIAIGSGGVFGKGWLHGTQSHLDFIPESTTDFIMAVYGEEFGLLGDLVLLLAYLAVIARGLLIARSAASTYGRLLAGSLTLAFFSYAFVNIGMVSGILPVVGVPLPFISYGGTALVTLMIGFGMLMSIRTHRPLMKG